MSNQYATVNVGNRRQSPTAAVVAALGADNLPESVSPSNPLPVTIAGSNSGVNLVVTTYTCSAAFTGASVGDIITETQVINTGTTPTTLYTIWRNQTTNADLASAPASANIALEGTTACTSAQLTTALGTDATSASPLSGGAGVRGWLSSIYKNLTSGILVNGGLVTATNGLPIVDAYSAPTATTWNSGSTVGSVSQVTTSGMDTVIVTLVTGGTHSGGSVAFEVYDGAAWIPVKSASVSDYTTTSTTTLTANMNLGYQIPVAGFPAYRSRLITAPTSGTLTITTVVSSAPDTSIVTAGLDPGSPLPAGTNTLGNARAAAALVNTDYNAITQATWSVSGTKTGATTITDAAGAACSFDVNVTSFTSTGTTDLFLQESPDGGTTWYDLWQCERITAAGHLRIPALPIAGVRRFAYLHNTAVPSALSVTIKANDLSITPPRQAQFFDAALAGTATVKKGTSYDIAGMKQFSVLVNAGAATAAAQFTVETSIDGTSWVSASSAITATASTVTNIPVTAGTAGRFLRVACTNAGTSALITAVHIYATA